MLVEQEPLTSLEIRSEVLPDGQLAMSLARVDVDDSGPGEVVVRVEAAPINPTDLGMLLGPANLVDARTEGGGRGS